MMRILRAAALLGVAMAAEVPQKAAETPSKTTQAPACTATSSSGSGAFFDLRPVIAKAPEKGKTHWTGVTKDYYSRGYDYGKNFTMNICGAVLDPVKEVTGVKESQWANVSAYYTSQGEVYSIGSLSMDLQSRGRKLILQYTGGSPCGTKTPKKSRADVDDLTYKADEESSSPNGVEALDKTDDYYDEEYPTETKRKSTLISFLCDHDPANTQASLAFVGTDPDECAYFFEARSIHACAGAEPHKPGSVGPGSIFGLILLIAVLVYVLGGVFYNRTVTHARGWRQLPNYSIWAGMWSFFSDMFVIATASCARFLPGRSGYSQLGSSPSRRERNAEAENRLIDQLDEEWDE